MYGESEETRTLDSHIKSVLLYQLSYTLTPKSAHLVERAFLKSMLVEMERFELPATRSQSVPSTIDLHLDVIVTSRWLRILLLGAQHLRGL